MSFQRADHKENEQRRRSELAQIHIAKAQLGLSDDEYRLMLQSVAGVQSAADCDQRRRTAILDHLKSLGFRIAGRRIGRRPHNAAPRGSRPRSSRQEQLGKIEALLTVGGKSWGYADALAQRICKVETLAFVPDYELYKVITALRLQARREGWDLSGEERR